MVGTVRFGWSLRGHAAINDAAWGMMQAGPLAAFVDGNRAEIQDIADLQDKQFSGRGHFLNAEHYWQNNLPKKLPVKDRQFSKVADVFRPAQRKKRQAEFERHVDQVDDGCCGKPENVYQSVLKNYEDLVRLLKSLSGGRQMGKRARAQKEAAIEGAIGRLVHYAGDLAQPMHVTLYYNWHLPISYKNSHAFFENRLFFPSELQDWARAEIREAQNDGYQPPVRDRDTLRSELKKTMTAGYGHLFDIVAVDRDARNRKLDEKAYRQALRDGWQPIAERRMSEAARLIASLLDSAYNEAGQPSLDQLA